MYNGTLYLSLNKRWCLFPTNLSLIVKVGSMSHFPLNMPLHILSWLPLHRMPTRPPSTLLASLVYNLSDILYLPLQESSMTCWPGIILIWHQLHWHQFLNTYRMLSIPFLNGTAGYPMVLFDFLPGVSTLLFHPITQGFRWQLKDIVTLARHNNEQKNLKLCVSIYFEMALSVDC